MRNPKTDCVRAMLCHTTQSHYVIAVSENKSWNTQKEKKWGGTAWE